MLAAIGGREIWEREFLINGEEVIDGIDVWGEVVFEVIWKRESLINGEEVIDGVDVWGEAVFEVDECKSCWPEAFLLGSEISANNYALRSQFLGC